ncbi:MAG: hypothetical protein AB7D51_03260 [Desulfovibrionaceae bacterium]
MLEITQEACQVYATARTAGNTRQTTNTGNGDQTPDSVCLSDQAGLLASFFSGINAALRPGEPLTLQGMQAELDSSREQFTKEATALFLENGISTDPPVELTTDGTGAVRVVGDHPQKERIEQLFEDNPSLAGSFRSMGALASLVEAGQEYLEFSA